jgi:hypothetical protein
LIKYYKERQAGVEVELDAELLSTIENLVTAIMPPKQKSSSLKLKILPNANVDRYIGQILGQPPAPVFPAPQPNPPRPPAYMHPPRPPVYMHTPQQQQQQQQSYQPVERYDPRRFRYPPVVVQTQPYQHRFVAPHPPAFNLQSNVQHTIRPSDQRSDLQHGAVAMRPSDFQSDNQARQEQVEGRRFVRIEEIRDTSIPSPQNQRRFPRLFRHDDQVQHPPPPPQPSPSSFSSRRYENYNQQHSTDDEDDENDDENDEESQ